MTLWILFIAVTVGVLLLLVIPLLRRQAAAPARIAYDIVVYRDQLAEVERDVERGLLSESQAEAARTEILRRMLAAEDAELAEPGPEYRLSSGRHLRMATALVILVGIPLGSFGLYGLLGEPDLPGQPYASRQSDPDLQMTEMAANLAADLRAKPEADGFATLAETYFSLRRYGEAAKAFRQAVTMGLINGQMLASYGESLTLSSDGEVTPDAREAFQQALTLDRQEPRARFYLGLAKAQAGRFAEAVSIWRDLEKGSPADAPWLTMLKEHIALYAKQGGFDPASIQPVPPMPEGGKPSAQGPNPHAGADAGRPAASGTPAPSKDQQMAAIPGGDAAAAAVMSQSPEEQQKTIRSMVDGLAARLEQSPDDVDGWMRLGRAYQSLGEMDKAKQVWSKLLQRLPPDSPNRAELVKQLSSLPKN